VESVKI
jgi:hypothetical protein